MEFRLDVFLPKKAALPKKFIPERGLNDLLPISITLSDELTNSNSLLTNDSCNYYVLSQRLNAKGHPG